MAALVRHRRRVRKGTHKSDRKRKRFYYPAKLVERDLHLNLKQQTKILNKLKSRGHINFYKDVIGARKSGKA